MHGARVLEKFWMVHCYKQTAKAFSEIEKYKTATVFKISVDDLAQREELKESLSRKISKAGFSSTLSLGLENDLSGLQEKDFTANAREDEEVEKINIRGALEEQSIDLDDDSERDEEVDYGKFEKVLEKD